MTLTAEKLGKRFSREWIFRNFNYSFSEGTYALTGPNGSGKSTLLQTLWGQLPPSEGIIRYQSGDHDISLDDAFRHIAIATPYMDLIDELSVEELLHFHFSFKKIRDGKSPQDVMEQLGLAHARDKRIAQLSSGMRQRLKLGLAFFSETSLIFLDEPTSNLDRKSIEWYWHNLTAVMGKCIIFIASNLENEYPGDAKKIHLPDLKKVTM